MLLYDICIAGGFDQCFRKWWKMYSNNIMATLQKITLTMLSQDFDQTKK